MWKFFVAATAALAVAASTVAIAQQQRPPAAIKTSAPASWSAEDINAFSDARIAALKAGLKLTPEQEKNWPAVESAIRDLAKQRAASIDKMRASAAMTRDPVALLRMRADAMSEAAIGVRKLADAAEPLFKALDDGQKRRLVALVSMGRSR